jgi:hypothetical protein
MSVSDSGESEWNATARWCADGHTWIDQGDGTVSPAWGFGGTRMPVDNPLLCPDPARDEYRRVACPTCDRRYYRGSCRDVWMGPGCDNAYPPPVCLQPALGGNRWTDRELPFDGSDWCAWWIRKEGPWRLTFHLGYAGGQHWASIYRCWDVETGEPVRVDRTWQVRRARIEELPAHVLKGWWRDPRGHLIGNWRTPAPGGAGWLMSEKRAVALIEEAVALGVAGSEAQLMFDF